MILTCPPFMLLGLHRQSPKQAMEVLQPSKFKTHQITREKTIAERSLLVTELFIKSPVPGIDGQGGVVNKGGWGGSVVIPSGAVLTDT